MRYKAWPVLRWIYTPKEVHDFSNLYRQDSRNCVWEWTLRIWDEVRQSRIFCQCPLSRDSGFSAVAWWDRKGSGRMVCKNVHQEGKVVFMSELCISLLFSFFFVSVLEIIPLAPPHARQALYSSSPFEIFYLRTRVSLCYLRGPWSHSAAQATW